ncbi:hypothetical protein ABTF34_09250 [Acinetobacter baumannii]
MGFGDLILLLRYFFKLKVSTHPNDANKSVEEADHTIEKANASFQKIPLNEYKPDNSTLQASQ